MKKVLLPLIAAFALTASAQVIPNNFNYQGVIERTNAKVVVTFELVDEEGNVVYTEDQMVQTNKDGAFTAVIGKVNAEAWNEAWMNAEQAYTVKATIDGNEVTCPLQAVPYANIATTVVGLDNIYKDIEDLTLANRENKTDIADLMLRAENHDMTGAVAQTAYDMADANADAIAILSDDLQGLMEKSRDFANAADVVALQEETSAIQADLIQLQEDLVSTVATQEEVDGIKLDLESVGLAADKAGEIAATTYEELQDLKGTVDLLFSEEDGPIAALNEGFTQLAALVADNVALSDETMEGLTTTQQDVLELTEDNMTNKAAIAQLQQDVADHATELSEIQADFIKLQEDLVSTVATQEDIDAINALIANMDENTAQANEIIDALLEKTETTADGLAVAEQTLIELVEDNMSNKAAIAEMQTWQANVGENLDGLTPVIELLLEDNDANKEELSAIQADFIKLQEDLAAEAVTKDELAEVEDQLAQVSSMTQNFINSFNDEYMVPIQDAITELQTWQANVGENLEGLTPVIELLLEDNDANKEELSAIQADLIKLQEDLAAEAVTKDELTEVEDQLAQVSSMTQNFINSFNDEYMVPIYEAIEAVDVTSEVQGLSEAMRGKASVEAVTELEDQLTAVSSMTQNFINSFNDEYMVPINEAIESVGTAANQAGTVAYSNAEAIRAIIEALNANNINVEVEGY